MAKILLFMFVLAFTSLMGAEWHKEWERGVIFCESEQYQEAEKCFDSCISQIEKSEDENGFHVYIDRSRVYLAEKKYDKCIQDVSRVIDKESLNKHDKVRGLVTKVLANSCLGNGEDSMKDYEYLKSISSDFPIYEYTEDSMIIRNIPNCECYEKMVTNFLIKSKMCEKEEDIKKFDSRIWIIKLNKTKDCGCFSRQYVGSLSSISYCQEWCNMNYIVAQAWCSNHFKKLSCQITCLLAVDVIKEGCNYCCGTNGFYKNCIEPFGDILSYMDGRCDPAFD